MTAAYCKYTMEKEFEENDNLMRILDKEISNGMSHEKYLAIYKSELDPDISQIKEFQKLIKLKKQLLAILERKRHSDLKSHQVYARYENYNRAINHLWKFFRHECEDPKYNVDLKKAAEKQEEINKCMFRCIWLIRFPSKK